MNTVVSIGTIGRGRGRGRRPPPEDTFFQQSNVVSPHLNEQKALECYIENLPPLPLTTRGGGRGRARGKGLETILQNSTEISLCGSLFTSYQIKRDDLPKSIVDSPKVCTPNASSDNSGYSLNSSFSLSPASASEKGTPDPEHRISRKQETKRHTVTKQDSRLSRTGEDWLSSVKLSKEQWSFKPKPAPEPSTQILLGDLPSPQLTANEEMMTYFEKEVLIVLKKCECAERFDIIPPEFFCKWFAAKYRDLLSNEASLISGTGPLNFYLMWRHNVYVHQLMQKWLLYLVEVDKLDGIYSDDLEDVKGNWVAALAEDKKWYRAKVKDVYCGDSALITYPDCGDRSVVVSIDRLRHLPGNLWDLRSLCFKACLAGISSDAAEWDSNEAINDEFMQHLRNLEFVYAYVTKINDENIHEVQLREHGEHGIIISSKVEDRILQWKIDIHYGLTPDDVQKITIKEVSTVHYERPELWQIQTVNSPTAFMVRKVGGKNKWKDRMHNFYNGLEFGHLKLRQGKIGPPQSYVWFNDTNSTWCRVQIINASCEKQSCEIYLWDLGTIERAKFDDMRKIVPQFCVPPPEAFSCYLVDILPANNDHDNMARFWSITSIKEFRSLVPEKSIFSGLIITTKIDKSKIACLQLQLGVILMKQIVDAQVEPSYQESLQHILCSKGMAKANGISTGSWRTLEKCYLHYSKVTSEFESESASLMWKRDYDYYSKWDIGKNADVRKFTPSQIRKHLCFIKIIRAQSPMCIFVQIQERIPSLMCMMRSLRLYVTTEPKMAKKDFKCGLFVAAFCKRTGIEDDEHWYRGVIVKLLPLSKVQVILIDFGVQFTFLEDDVRHLPKRFLKQPSYAHRVHIQYPGLYPKLSTTYSKECCEFIRKYAKGWNGACPIYYIWRTQESQIIELDDMYQDLEFNFMDMKWQKCVSNLKGDSLFDDLKNHTLLSHLYMSIGVVIEFENFNPPAQPYTFTYLHKVLVDNDFAIQHCIT